MDHVVWPRWPFGQTRASATRAAALGSDTGRIRAMHTTSILILLHDLLEAEHLRATEVGPIRTWPVSHAIGQVPSEVAGIGRLHGEVDGQRQERQAHHVAEYAIKQPVERGRPHDRSRQCGPTDEGFRDQLQPGVRQRGALNPDDRHVEKVLDAYPVCCVDEPTGAVHVDTGGAAEEIARQHETAPRRGREGGRVHDRLRASHRLGNALAGAKVAPDPLDRRIVTGPPGEHPHPVAVLENVDQISAEVTRSPCHEEGFHLKRPIRATLETARNLPIVARASVVADSSSPPCAQR
jgi:hypothetical protein